MSRPYINKNVPITERFWSRVSKAGPDDCWEWMGSRDGAGYGQFTCKSIKHRVHIFSYELHHGPVPPDLLPSGVRKMRVCHKCDNRVCVNPSHLWLGAQSENMLDAFAKGRLKTSPLIQSNIERGRLSARIREQRKKGRLERITMGTERPRDEHGRMAGGVPLPPRQRDERGYFLPNPLTAAIEQLTPLRRMVRNAWFSQGEDFAAVEFAMGSGRSLGKIIKVMDWLRSNGLSPA